MAEPSLPEKVLALHRSLAEGRIRHAFGGALALAYYAEPRATIDIDVNVFVPPARYRGVCDLLSPLGVSGTVDASAIERDGQCRLFWGRTPIDLFFAYDAFHDAMKRRLRVVPFGTDRIPILAPEDLVVCKAVFNRPKDWLDIEQVVVSVERLDTEEIREWLKRLVGASDERSRLADELIRRLRDQ